MYEMVTSYFVGMPNDKIELELDGRTYYLNEYDALDIALALKYLAENIIKDAK